MILAVFIAAFFVFLLGIISGSVYYTRLENAAEVGEYLKSVCLMMSDSNNGFEIAKNIFTDNLICSAVIFFVSPYKFCIPLTAAVILRKGFVTGFTSAAAVGTFGIRGAEIILSTAFDTAVSVSALLLLGVFSAVYGIAGDMKLKKILKIFMIFSVGIFCVSATARGFFSTTFMKMLYPKF